MNKMKIKNGFTLTELLVAVGLLASILTASTIIFHYSIEAQRTAMATAEVMRSLRAITDQLNLNLEGLQKNGYLMLYSDTNQRDAIYFFSIGDFQSTVDDTIRSNIARIYFGPARGRVNDLLIEAKLLTPGKPGNINDDYTDVNFVDCQFDIVNKFEDPNIIVSTVGRPIFDSNDLLAQRVSNMKIEWTYDSNEWVAPKKKIEWYGLKNPKNDLNYEISTGSLYKARWSPYNQPKWPKALKFEFTLYDSRGILKGGRTFEHIVYIGN